MERKAWEHRPLWMCQQTTNPWKTEKWTMSKTRALINSSLSTFQLHHRGCNWSVHSPSQRPCMGFHDTVMVAHAGLNWPAYITTLPFSASLLLCTSLDCAHSPLTAGRIYCAKELSSSASLGLFITPKHWEAVICIYIRSLDQARGLLAQGVLVLPSAVSSDFRHASAGNVCTACIHPWSLSTSRLSCRLSLSLSSSLPFLPFSAPFPLSHFIMWYLHCHCHLGAESHFFMSCIFLSPSFLVPHLQHCTISVYWMYYVFSHISSFCQWV